MIKSAFVAAAFLFATAAPAQQYSTAPYDFILAKLASEEGRHDEALSKMDRLVKSDPDNAVLLYERAMMLIDAGRIDRAEGEFRKVVAKDPQFAEAQRVLGMILRDRAISDRSLVSEAIDHLLVAYRLNIDDIGTGSDVAQMLLSTGRIAEAEKVLATLVERAPDQRSFNFNYAQVLSNLGRASESTPYLERTLAVDPSFRPAVQQLIELYEKSGDWEKAARVLQPLVDDDPMNLDLQRQQAFFYLRAGDADRAYVRFKALTDADPNDARSRYFLAESLNELEQFKDAEKIYRLLLEKSPQDPDVLASLGLALTGQQRWDEATQTFNTLLGVPKLSDNVAALARTQLAYIDYKRGNYVAAIETARPVFVFNKNPNGQAINVALSALRDQKKYAEAVALLEPLVAQFPSDAFIAARYVEMLVRSGNEAKAAEFAEAQAKLGPRNAIAAGEAYMVVEDHAAAIAIVRKALESRQNDIDLQFQLGSLLERAGDRKGSEQAFLGLLDKTPDHAPSLNYLGYMWADDDVNLNRAEEMLVRAVAQEPRNGAYLDSLGWVYFRLGNLDLAQKYLEDAIKYVPRDATVHEHLGDVAARRGKKDDALRHYREALTLAPEAKEAAGIRTKVAELEKKK
ncbi:MAG: tetratricopeptide repeat protein [Thermoanaerobaculia bacterium]